MKSSIASLFLSAFLAITSMPSELAAQSDKAKKIILGVAGAIIANEILRNQPAQGAEINGGQTRSSAQATTSGATSYLSSLSKRERAEIQSDLNHLGFEVGVADGVFGRKTNLGITKFQNRYGYEVTGVISEDQRIVLRRASSETNDLAPLPERSLSTREVKLLQTALRKLGYYQSTVDGVAGKGTGRAVVDFLKDRNHDANETDARAALIMALSAVRVAIPEYLEIELGYAAVENASGERLSDDVELQRSLPSTEATGAMQGNIIESRKIDGGSSGGVPHRTISQAEFRSDYNFRDRFENIISTKDYKFFLSFPIEGGIWCSEETALNIEFSRRFDIEVDGNFRPINEPIPVDPLEIPGAASVETVKQETTQYEKFLLDIILPTVLGECEAVENLRLNFYLDGLYLWRSAYLYSKEDWIEKSGEVFGKFNNEEPLYYHSIKIIDRSIDHIVIFGRGDGKTFNPKGSRGTR